MRKRKKEDEVENVDDLVNISKPLLVTPTVCSNCADKDLSFVTAVQPSLSTFVVYEPSFTIGSTVNIIPVSN